MGGAARVRLRSAGPSDLPRFLRWFNDPVVVRFLDLAFPIVERDERAWLEGLAHRTDLLVMVIEREPDGTAIGTIGLSNIDRRRGTAEIGLTVGEPGEWGKGYGTAAVQSMLPIAFETLRLRKLWLRVDADHAAAIRIYERCGFGREGYLRHERNRKGRPVDELRMALLRNEWVPEPQRARVSA